MKKAKRKIVSRTTKSKGSTSFISSHKTALIIVLGIFTILFVSQVVASMRDNNSTLGVNSYLARGGDDSDSGSSGSSNSESGSSGSGSNESDSSGSDDSDDDDNDSSGSSGSGISGSGSSGTQSVIVTPRPTRTLLFSLTPVPTLADRDEEVEDTDDDEVEIDDKVGEAEIEVEDGQTRLEQEIFENGVRKRIEMRNENGRIFVRVKTEDALGNETDQRLELRPEDGRAKLTFEENGVEKEVTIKVQSGRFVIEQEGFGTTADTSAFVNFPLTIDTETNSIAVTTPLGVINVQQLPSTAIDGLLSSNVIDTIDSTELDETESNTEDANEQVVYRIKGVKNTRFLGLITVDAPILAEVSAITGEQVFVQQPWYLNAFGFLFTK